MQNIITKITVKMNFGPLIIERELLFSDAKEVLSFMDTATDRGWKMDVHAEAGHSAGSAIALCDADVAAVIGEGR